MSAIGWVRNGLIFAGLGMGGFLAVRAAARPAQALDGADAPQSAPVVLNTARPAESPVAMLAKPISLESPFGRTEITGIATFRVSPDPLSDLGVNRDFDGNIDLPPPKGASDLPPAKAADEVVPGNDDQPVPVRPLNGFGLDDLPKEAREFADLGRAALEEGNKLLTEGLDKVRGGGRNAQEGNRILGEAARQFEAARDHFRDALARVPNHAGVIDLIQQAKANLFTARKHATSR